MSTRAHHTIELRFRTAYWTKWGQSLVVIGTWDGAAKRGHQLSCRHDGDSLVWEGKLTIPANGDHVSYKYAVVNEAGEVDVEEGSTRKLMLPKELMEGGAIDLHDEWQVRCYPWVSNDSNCIERRPCWSVC